MTEKVKIILVEDSAIVQLMLKRILEKSNEIEVLGTANNGKEGLALAQKLNPDVICTDLMMPVMDGLEFTKQIMAVFPKPILVISASLQGNDETNVFSLLQAGAVDVFPKPSGGEEKDYESISKRLVSKIKVLKSVPVYKKVNKDLSGTASFPAIPISRSKLEYLVIGASTGGPKAIQTILSVLPKDFPIPIICVQHISDGFIDSMVNWLASNTKLKVKIMQEGEKALKGVVYFPQNMKHLVINKDGTLSISKEISSNGHTPSVNVTFKSFAQYFGPKTLAVLLTGMGDDGASGLLSIKHLGGRTIGEDQSTCVVYGMPKVAKEIGATEFVLPLDKISPKIISLI